MEQRTLTFKESALRKCSLRLTNCCGPTAHGLDGYVCENCLAYIAAQFAAGQSLSELTCGYCGKTPTFAGVRGIPICESCAQKGLRATRSWYSLHGEGAGNRCT
jgi:hypothetical protein